MKKLGLLNLLENMKARNEMLPAEHDDVEMTPMEIVKHLLDYINDPDIRKAVDEIPF